MSLLTNAIESIQVGIEDYILMDADDKRYLSSVRNICAGILLLYKEKLSRLSPKYQKELLIKKNIELSINEQRDIIFIGKGDKTVDVYEIKERFKSLKIIENKEYWKKFDELNQLRNNIEHYYTDKSPDAVREVVAKSFLLIRDFIIKYLEEEPLELLGEECWQTLLKTAEVYKKEEEDCKKSFDKIEWQAQELRNVVEQIRCTACHSSLIKTEDEDEFSIFTSLSCSYCGNCFEFGEVMEECLLDSKHLSEESLAYCSEESLAYCNECEYTEQKSVVPIGDEWLCLSCHNIYEQIGGCGYCNEIIAGDLEDTFLNGCLMCEGQMEHYLNSSAYNHDE